MIAIQKYDVLGKFDILDFSNWICSKETRT